MSMNGSDKFLECRARASKSKQISYRAELARRFILAGFIGTCVGSVGVVTESKAQQLLPADREEIADQERLSWTLQKYPPQPYMNEIYWPYSKDTPAFFRDSLVQFVARTYYLTRDNFDGSRSQAWAAGGWLAFRSGLIGDVFGVHVAGYTSQPIFAPLDEGGTKLLGAAAEFDRRAWTGLWAHTNRRSGNSRRPPIGRHASDQSTRQSHGAKHV